MRKKVKETWLPIVVSAIITLAAASVESCVVYRTTQKELAKLQNEVEALEKQTTAQSLWHSFAVLKQDINAMWLYHIHRTPQDPTALQVIDDAKKLSQQARAALDEEKFDEARQRIWEASTLLRSMPGPPTGLMEPEPIREWPELH